METSTAAIARAQFSLDEAMRLLDKLGDEMAAKQKKDAEDLLALSRLHGIRIIEDKRLQAGDIIIAVSPTIWALLRTADSTTQPIDTQPESNT